MIPTPSAFDSHYEFIRYSYFRSVIGAAILGGVLLAAGAAPASAAEVEHGLAGRQPERHREVPPGQEADQGHQRRRSSRTPRRPNRFAGAKATTATPRAQRNYTGAWQFDGQTWRSHGGKQFSKEAAKAPKWARDYVMWRTHKSRGWQPAGWLIHLRKRDELVERFRHVDI